MKWLIILTLLLACKGTLVHDEPKYHTRTETRLEWQKQALEMELMTIKSYEGFRSKPYSNGDGHIYIGYGIQTPLWTKLTAVNEKSADSLLRLVYGKMLNLSVRDFPNRKDSLKIAHLYFWYGETAGRRFIKSGKQFTSKRLRYDVQVY